MHEQAATAVHSKGSQACPVVVGKEKSIETVDQAAQVVSEVSAEHLTVTTTAVHTSRRG
jgi:hypothetical protein